MTIKKFFNRASWIIFVVLLFPAGAVQASKNAMPGEAMYPVKLVLEDAVLLMMKPSNSITSDMEMKFTKRRLLEVEQVADTPFVIKSLKSLNEQVVDTTVAIGKVKNLEKQSKLVDEYIQTLRETQTSLEQQKYVEANKTAVANANNYTYTTNQVVNNNYYYYSPTPQQNNFNTGSESEVVAKPSDPLPTQQPLVASEQTEEAPPIEEVQIEIEETQAAIETQIEELEEVAKKNAEKQQVKAVEKLEDQLQKEIEKAQKEQQKAIEEVQEASQQQTHDDGDSWRGNSWGNRNDDHDD